MQYNIAEYVNTTIKERRIMAGKRKSLKAVEAAKARKKQRSRKKRRAIILGLEIVILLLLMGTAFVMAKYDKFQTVAIDADDIMINEGVKQEGYSTYILFGGDSREGELEAGAHADTMIIVSLDNKTKEIRMASVYRDTLLEMMNQDYHKANQAYFRGGPVEAINMLNKNLDLAIEDYATVDFKALADAIDLLGGVEINVSDAEAKALNKYINETAKVAGKEAHPLNGGGTYTLDGPQAVTYARIRKLAGGDYKRTERQRVVIKAMFNKAKKMDVATLNSIIDTVFPQVSTSLTLKELMGLTAHAVEYKLGDSTGFPFDKTDGNFNSAGSVVVALGHAENVKQLHEFLYPSDADYTLSSVVQGISDNITSITGVVRPAELDAQAEEAAQAEEPVITTEDTDAVTEEQ